MNIYIIVSNNFRLILVEPPARDVEGQQFFIYAPKFSILSTNMIKIIKRIEVPKIIMLKFRALQRLVFFRGANAPTTLSAHGIAPTRAVNFNVNVKMVGALKSEVIRKFS